ncbi:MAG: EscU/YscU/HrcU family type III secretion system export apparatus switch protein [Congregibacter sp.]
MTDYTRQDAERELQTAALSYSGMGAPVLVAKGEGETARRIVAVAREHDVPIVQDDQLTELLCQIPLGDEVPPKLYVAVAEVLAFVYRLNESIDHRV